MKTFLKFVALFSVASMSAVIAAEFAGVSLPHGFNGLSTFAAFVVAQVLLTAFSDYSRGHRARGFSLTASCETEKAAHPLAA